MTAMHLLQAGVDLAVIALWLGHESPVTTHGYIEADLAMKERAIATLAPPEITGQRYHPTDVVLKFLESLLNYANLCTRAAAQAGTRNRESCLIVDRG